MSLTHVLSLQKFGKGVSAWLENDTLWKEFKAEPGGGATVTCSPLRWKSGKVRHYLSASDVPTLRRTSSRRQRRRRTA